MGGRWLGAQWVAKPDSGNHNSGVAAFIYPPKPIFKSSGERQVFDALKPLLSDGDALFANLNLTDPVEGDIEIDIVLLLKDYGAMIIEVKSAHITFENGRWMQSDPSGSREIDPAYQARRNTYALRDYIYKHWSLGTLRTDWMVAFPHSNVVDVRDPNLPMDKIIQKSGLPYAMSAVRNRLTNIRGFELPSYDGWVEVATKVLIPLSAQKIDREGVLGNNYEFVRGLTHERELILDQLSDNNRYYVKGPAGSGKTWLAFEQAKRWTKEGMRVGILAFNRGIVTYMNTKNAELPENEQIAMVDTFHGFAEWIGSSAGNPANYGDPIDRYREDLILRATQLTDEDKFDAWVIDEAQDFLPSWWETLKLALNDPVNGKMALFGDDQQAVFGHRPPPEGFFAAMRLTENLRNSQQIAKAVSKFIERPTTSRGPFSFEIEYVVAGEDGVMETAEDVVANLTDNERWWPGEIAMLTTKKRHGEHAAQADTDIDAYWEDLWAGENVFYCTIGGFKGLERPVVVLAVNGFHEDNDQNDVLYVGMSRARDKLVIVGDAEIIDRLKALNQGEN